MTKKFILPIRKGDKMLHAVLETNEDMGKEDILSAIRKACDDYVGTDEGAEMLKGNRNSFTYHDFLEHVPNRICAKYGIRKEGPAGAYAVADCVDMDTQLIGDTVLFTANLSTQDIIDVIQNKGSLVKAICDRQVAEERTASIKSGTAAAIMSAIEGRYGKALSEAFIRSIYGSAADDLLEKYVTPDIQSLKLTARRPKGYPPEKTDSGWVTIGCRFDMETFAKVHGITCHPGSIADTGEKNNATPENGSRVIIIINDGILTDVRVSKGLNLDIDALQIDKDCEDYDRLRKHEDKVYEDSSMYSADFGSIRFTEED